jgi:HK97 family phage prohead protease
MARPRAGEVEQRTAPDLLATEDRKIRGRIPYGTESRDLGGFTEIIEPGALASTEFDDLVVTVDHVGLPLGRFPGTLELEDRDDGLHWAVDPPKSRDDIREAVERGDLKAGSWRMVVARDSWDGDVRHVHEISVLRDVSIVTRPAYEAAVVELRNHNEVTGQGKEAVQEQENTEGAPSSRRRPQKPAHTPQEACGSRRGPRRPCSCRSPTRTRSGGSSRTARPRSAGTSSGPSGPPVPL